jgi:hypothetical protein
LAITSPTSGGRSVGIVRSRIQTMEFVFVCFFLKEEMKRRDDQKGIRKRGKFIESLWNLKHGTP